MEISIKWNICRVCLQEEQKSCKKGDAGSNIKFVNLFKVNKKLAIQIFELSGVSMKPDDSLPDKICTKCVAAVNSAVQFRETCCSSNTYLQSILERTKSASTLPKPEISTCQINNDAACKGNLRTESSTLEDELQHDIVDINNFKDESQTSHTLYSLEHQADEEEIQLELNDNISDYTVELEEIIEMSDEEESCTERTTDDADDNSLNKLEKNTGVKQYDSNANDIDLAEFRKIGLADSNSSDEDLIENEDLVSEKCMAYTAADQEENPESNIDDSLMVDEEEQIIDNEDQAQVSSTVYTKEEIECYEDDSNISHFHSDLGKELMDGNFSNCNISSTKSSEASKETHSHNRKVLKKHSDIEESTIPTLYPKRRTKRSVFKAAAYEPVKVCVCEICGNRFTNQTQMKLHMKVHLQYKNHQCELCYKRFITACNLQAHMRIHTGEKPFECKYCGRRFNDRSSHIRHERTHTNEKPFKCCNCGKTFSLATTLQNHMKVHSNERSYRCEPCGKSFKLRHHLKTHQNTTLHRSVLQIADDDE